MADDALAQVNRARLECQTLAKIATPPVWMPVEIMPPDEWGAMSEEDRTEAALGYRLEVIGSMEGLVPQFPVIKTPQGALLQWVLPDGTVTPVVKGTILGHYPARGWWKSEEITNTLPDCSSIDNVHPEAGKGPAPAFSTTCADCPNNQYGSGRRGRGKACKERMNVFFLRTGHAIPWKLSIPPTGLKAYNAYVTSLVDGRPPRAISSVETEFKLEKARGALGHDYAQAVCSVGSFLTRSAMLSAIKIRTSFIDHMRKSGVTVHDGVTDAETPPSSGDAVNTELPPRDTPPDGIKL